MKEHQLPVLLFSQSMANPAQERTSDADADIHSPGGWHMLAAHFLTERRWHLKHFIITLPILLIDNNGKGETFTVDMIEETWISDVFIVQGQEYISQDFSVGVSIYTGESSRSLKEAREKCFSKLRKAGIPPKNEWPEILSQA